MNYSSRFPVRLHPEYTTLNQVKIAPSSIEKIYQGLNRIGALDDSPEAGFNRPAYSPTETEAMEYIESLAKSASLESHWDDVGNLIVETPEDFNEWIETGSHIDTVSGGGNYDGTAGVVAGLAVLQEAQRSDIPLTKGLRLRVWRGEESAAFGVVSIGSRAAFGQLPSVALKSKYLGQTLAEAMKSQGIDPELIKRGGATIEENERDNIAAHIELHIEQGSVLETERAEIGIVTGIRGSIRSWVKLCGAFDHSGATPMGRPYRCDVNLAMAYMQVELDKIAHEAIAEGQDVVQTIGIINGSELNDDELSANAVTKVSGYGHFSHEVRSASPEQAEAFVEVAYNAIRKIAAEHGVTVEIDTFSRSSGIEALDDNLQKVAETSCKELNLSYRHLPSGAWHDAAVLCGVKRGDGSTIPVGMLFIPCRNGISHSADEFSSPEQIAAGATVLANMMVKLAS